MPTPESCCAIGSIEITGQVSTRPPPRLYSGLWGLLGSVIEPVFETRFTESRVIVWNQSAERSRAQNVLVIAQVALALVLLVGGVDGILAYAVAQRRREISIRLAVGAERRTIKALFLRWGLMLMCMGGAIGFVLARGLSPWMAALLFGIRPFDPLTYGISGLIILAAALAASYVPARKAALLNPIEALRAD